MIIMNERFEILIVLVELGLNLGLDRRLREKGLQLGMDRTEEGKHTKKKLAE